MKQIYAPITLIIFGLITTFCFSQEYGTASYYNRKFNGRKTQSGEKLDNKKFTAAHKTLPFGTYVRVTNLKNDSWVIVKVNDRGHFKKGRVIDVTYAAAKELNMFRNGVIKVKVETIPYDSVLNNTETTDSIKPTEIKKQNTLIIKDTLFYEIK
jgi:rare lipoprotein A